MKGGSSKCMGELEPSLLQTKEIFKKEREKEENLSKILQRLEARDSYHYSRWIRQRERRSKPKGALYEKQLFPNRFLKPKVFISISSETSAYHFLHSQENVLKNSKQPSFCFKIKKKDGGGTQHKIVKRT